MELAIFLITILTGLKKNIYVILYVIIFVFEVVWFLNFNKPYSPHDLLMIIAGAIRIYIIIWLFKQFKRRTS